MKKTLASRSYLPAVLLAFALVLMLAPTPAEAIPCEARCFWGPSSAVCGCYEPTVATITCNEYWYYGCPGRVAGPTMDSEAGLSTFEQQMQQAAPFSPMNPSAQPASQQRPLEPADPVETISAPESTPQIAPPSSFSTQQTTTLEMN